MSVIVFHNLQSRQEFSVGKMLYLDDSDGFDEDFCASSRPGDELRLLQAREPGVALPDLRYAHCEVKKADYSGIDVQIISEMSLGELMTNMEVQDNFSATTIIQWTQSYISRAGDSSSLIEKLPFNLPRKSMLAEARLKTEVLAEHYNNSRNTLYIRYLASTDVFRILYARNDRKWYSLIYDLFRADDLFRQIEEQHDAALTTTVKTYWDFFLH
jgi:hypothetical protein